MGVPGAPTAAALAEAEGMGMKASRVEANEGMREEPGAGAALAGGTVAAGWDGGERGRSRGRQWWRTWIWGKWRWR